MKKLGLDFLTNAGLREHRKPPLKNSSQVTFSIGARNFRGAKNYLPPSNSREQFLRGVKLEVKLDQHEQAISQSTEFCTLINAELDVCRKPGMGLQNGGGNETEKYWAGLKNMKG